MTRSHAYNVPQSEPMCTVNLDVGDGPRETARNYVGSRSVTVVPSPGDELRRRSPPDRSAKA